MVHLSAVKLCSAKTNTVRSTSYLMKEEQVQQLKQIAYTFGLTFLLS